MTGKSCVLSSALLACGGYGYGQDAPLPPPGALPSRPPAPLPLGPPVRPVQYPTLSLTLAPVAEAMDPAPAAPAAVPAAAVAPAPNPAPNQAVVLTVPHTDHASATALIHLHRPHWFGFPRKGQAVTPPAPAPAPPATYGPYASPQSPRKFFP